MFIKLGRSNSKLTIYFLVNILLQQTIFFGDHFRFSLVSSFFPSIQVWMQIIQKMERKSPKFCFNVVFLMETTIHPSKFTGYPNLNLHFQNGNALILEITWVALVHKTWLALLGQLFKVLVFWCGHATSVLHRPPKLFSHLVIRHLSCLKIFYSFLHASRSSERFQMNSEFFFSSSYAATLRNVAPNSLDVSGGFRPWGNTEGEKDSRHQICWKGVRTNIP